MNQKLVALLATALTAFLLVAAGGVVGRLAAHRAEPATVSAPATPSPPLASRDPLAAPEQAQQTASPTAAPLADEDGRWSDEPEHRDDHDDDDEHDDDDD